MRGSVIYLFSLLALCLGVGGQYTEAATIKLRGDCSQESGLCLTTIDAVLQEVAAASPPPSPSAPLLVDIGPGRFSLGGTSQPYCSALSNITFRGSGTSSTVITGGGFWHFADGSRYAVWLEDCDDVSFEHLTIEAISGSSDSGVIFFGSGKSYWRDVVIQSVRWGWWDQDGGSHYWWDTVIDVDTSPAAITSGAFYSRGGTHSVRSSEFRLHIPQQNSLTPFVPIPATAMYLYNGFRMKMQGSAVRQTDDRAGFIASYAIVAGPEFSCNPAQDQFLDIQGSRLAIQSGFGAAAVYLKCADVVRIRGTQFDLDAPIVRRIHLAAPVPPQIEAPYSCGARQNAPPISAPTPEGQDTYIETDCSDSLCADTPQGDKHHLLTFDAGCSGAGPWFDTFTGKCRGVL